MYSQHFMSCNMLPSSPPPQKKLFFITFEQGMIETNGMQFSNPLGVENSNLGARQKMSGQAFLISFQTDNMCPLDDPVIQLYIRIFLVMLVLQKILFWILGNIVEWFMWNIFFRHQHNHQVRKCKISNQKSSKKSRSIVNDSPSPHIMYCSWLPSLQLNETF